MKSFQRFQRDPDDRQAFAEWYRETYPAVFMTAYRVALGNRATAEDLSHEAIVAFVTRGGLRKVMDEHGALAYLKRAVTNGYIDALRARKHEIDAEPPEPAADSYIPELVELSQEYDALVETLDESDRELLRMIIAGHTLPEIAGAFAISYSAAGVRVHRIKNKIRELWRKNDGR